MVPLIGTYYNYRAVPLVIPCPKEIKAQQERKQRIKFLSLHPVFNFFDIYIAFKDDSVTKKRKYYFPKFRRVPKFECKSSPQF